MPTICLKADMTARRRGVNVRTAVRSPRTYGKLEIKNTFFCHDNYLKRRLLLMPQASVACDSIEPFPFPGTCNAPIRRVADDYGKPIIFFISFCNNKLDFLYFVDFPLLCSFYTVFILYITLRDLSTFVRPRPIGMLHFFNVTFTVRGWLVATPGLYPCAPS